MHNRTWGQPLVLPVVLQVHVVSRNGKDSLLASFDDQPSYAQLQVALKQWPEAASNKSLIDRIKDEVQFIQDTAQAPKQ